MQNILKRASRRIKRTLGVKEALKWGSLRRLTPISHSFGLARGWPIDRYYIETFLERYRGDIHGRVLEAGGLVNYAKKYGAAGRLDEVDILYPKAGFPDATLVADLESGTNLPRQSFDCIILTQVYPFIYDVRAAIRHTYEALKPGGVLLATLPGISQICRYDKEQWGDYWRFTDSSVHRLFAEVFGSDNVTVETRGNVLTACAFLQGLAIEDLKPEELEHNDRDYQLSIAVRAMRPRLDS